jgi:hypothetical protein
MMAHFALTERHIETKELSSKDLSVFAGMPVVKFSFSQFSGWETLKREGHLSPAAVSVRAKEIEQTLCAKESPFADVLAPESYFSPSKKLFDYSQIYEAAQSQFPIVESSDYLHECDRDPFEHFRKVIEYGVDAVVNPSAGGGSRFVFPGAFSEKQADVENVFRANAAFMLLYDSENKVTEDFWSSWTGIPRYQLDHSPNDGWHIVADGLHELRHVVQEYSGGTMLNRGREMDADLFCRAVLRQHNVGEQTRTGWMHARYIDLLSSRENYWIAPTLEALETSALETRQAAPDFDGVSCAVTEIRLRLAMEKNGASCRRSGVDFERVQATPAFSETMSLSDMGMLKKQYDEEIVSSYRRGNMPADLFSLLFKVIAKRDFSCELTAKIADRILEAANYFAPNLVRDSALRPTFFIPASSQSAAVAATL